MVRLFGANPLLGLVLGIAMLAAGFLTDRPFLAVAGGVVGIASGLRVVTDGGPRSGREGRPHRRGQRWRY